jgi:hypothetical protein
MRTVSKRAEERRKRDNEPRRQPLRGGGKVGKEPDSSDTHGDGDESFDDEEPNK